MSSPRPTEAHPFLQALAIFGLIVSCMWLPMLNERSKAPHTHHQAVMGW